MLDVEFSILDFIQNQFRTSFGDFVMPLISKLGNGGKYGLFYRGCFAFSRNTEKPALQC